MNQTHYDVIIIGAGAAGLTAALFLKRSSINCCIIEGGAPGGQMLKSPLIENYPGVSKISGIDLAKNMLNQVNELKVDYVAAEVQSIKIEDNIKNVITDKGTLGAENIIIATGRVPRTFDFLNPTFEGKGISYCAICDGPLYKNKDVVVIGQGDSAVEAVLYLSSLAKSVTLICKDDYLKAKDMYQDHLKYLDNLNILYKTNVIDFKEENGIVVGVETNKGIINSDGCFIFIGHTPASEVFSNLNITNKDGYIETDNNMQTQVRGVYAIGDVRCKKVFQLTTAVGDATTAAVNIIKDLSK